MFRRASLLFCVVLASFGLIAVSHIVRAQDDDSHHGRKYKVPPPSAHIAVTVVRAYNGKPISDAHVIFHPIEGDKDRGALELKTNEDGKAIIDVIPIGDTVTLQVIANGFQTYGQVYKIDKPNMAMEVRMNRPTSQYSIYKNSTPNSGSDNRLRLRQIFRLVAKLPASRLQQTNLLASGPINRIRPQPPNSRSLILSEAVDPRLEAKDLACAPQHAT